VTDSLYDFLRIHAKSERSEDREFLWIDAICINQQDAIEKGPQVQIMGIIYKRADSVIVWLCKSHDPLAKEYQNAIAFMKYADRHSGESSIATEFFEVFGNDDVHFLSVLKAFFRHPYWSRVWTVQEVVLASKIWVRVGKQQIAWDTLDFWTRSFSTVLMAIGKGSSPQRNAVVRSREEENLVFDRREWSKGRTLEVSSILRTRTSEVNARTPVTVSLRS
jgi:hypothetical protein